jgi:hypothetical protein
LRCAVRGAGVNEIGLRGDQEWIVSLVDPAIDEYSDYRATISKQNMVVVLFPFVFPADPRSNNDRVFVITAATREVRFL